MISIYKCLECMSNRITSSPDPTGIKIHCMATNHSNALNFLYIYIQNYFAKKWFDKNSLCIHLFHKPDHFKVLWVCQTQQPKIFESTFYSNGVLSTFYVQKNCLYSSAHSREWFDLKFVSLIVDYDFEALGLPKPFWKDRINKIFCWCLSQKNNTAIRLKILKSNESCNLIG